MHPNRLIQDHIRSMSPNGSYPELLSYSNKTPALLFSAGALIVAILTLARAEISPID